ncbi:MAG: hypothetical protein IE933_08995 [Sphingomonadales bacterium]|nr:hypothetical protein [Sphingomonadales bacterium]MBD3773651.1 hypothetical protein [Paracoccaceae bacterium]
MMRLALILHLVISTMLMGMGITAVLAAGMGTPKLIILAAAAGFVLSIPFSWFVAKQVLALQEKQRSRTGN